MTSTLLLDVVGLTPRTLAHMPRLQALASSGARARLGADIAASVTGIAGPGGVTPGKPVGLTFVAVADADGTTVLRHVWGGDRSANKRSSAAAALALLLERLLRPRAGPGDEP